MPDSDNTLGVWSSETQKKRPPNPHGSGGLLYPVISVVAVLGIMYLGIVEHIIDIHIEFPLVAQGFQMQAVMLFIDGHDPARALAGGAEHAVVQS